MNTPIHVCDACDNEWWGATKREVLEHGWRYHDAKNGRMFVMCRDCERRFAERRRGVRTALDSRPIGSSHPA